MYGSPDIPLEMSFDWLFSRVNQEDVYMKYFGFCDLNTKYTNPLRVDKKADCNFFWNNGVLFFKDFAYKTYTCVMVVMEMENISYYQALWKIYDIFIKKNNSINNLHTAKIVKKPNTERKNLQVKCVGYRREDVLYMKEFGVHTEFFKLANWFSVDKIWINDNLIWYYRKDDPCIGYYFGQGKWKLYFYKRKEYRFLSNCSQDILQGEHLLPEKSDYLVITKSYKDVGVLHKFNIPSVAPQAESIILSNNQMSRLYCVSKTIFTLSDYDNAGIHFAWQMRKLYNTIPLFFTEKLWSRKQGYLGAKDISDFFKLHGENNLLNLINNVKKDYGIPPDKR
jgi:hypothetical protein